MESQNKETIDLSDLSDQNIPSLSPLNELVKTTPFIRQVLSNNAANTEQIFLEKSRAMENLDYLDSEDNKKVSNKNVINLKGVSSKTTVIQQHIKKYESEFLCSSFIDGNVH